MNGFQKFFLILICTCLISSSVEARRKNPILESAKKWVDEKLVAVPQDLEVCFSPDEPCDIKLIKLVQSAQKSIDVAVFDINLDQLVHELLVASKKIPVRIVVDSRQAKGDHSLVPLMIKAGAQIRYGRQRGLMHNKFIIIDGKMVETGSFNYTNHARKANNENQVYLADPNIVTRYKNRFEEIWAQARLP